MATKKKAAKKKAAAKKAPAKKAPAKKAAAKTSGKQVQTEKANGSAGEAQVVEQKAPEADVKAAVAEINEALAECGQTKAVTNHSIGKKLNDLREICSDPQFKDVVTNRIVGADGQPKKKAWAYQQMSIATAFTEKQAVDLGMAKCIQVIRVKDLADRKELIKDGLVVEDGEGNEVEKSLKQASVAELKDFINTYLKDKSGKKDPTPKEQFLADVEKLQKTLDKFEEKHGSTMKRSKFDVEQLEVVTATIERCNNFAETLGELTPTSEAAEAIAAQQQAEEAGGVEAAN